MKYLLIIFITGVIYAQSLDEVISIALKNNPSLESINERINANKEDIKLSTKFDNPTLALKMNAISTTKPLDRKIERMQWTSVGFKQKIPFFGKRDAKKSIALANEEVLFENLNNAKVALVDAVKRTTYSIWEVEQLLMVLEKYQTITKQNIDLFETYTQTTNNKHMGLVSAELTLSELKTQKSNLTAMLEDYYSKLSFLSAKKINKVEVDLNVSEMESFDTLYEKLLNQNHDIAMRDKEINRAKASLKLAQLDHYPDFSLDASYHYRASIDDYVSVGLSVSLPIYGSEDSKEARAKALMLEVQNKKEDVENMQTSELHALYSKLKSQSEIYEILTKTSTPQIDHMFDLESASVSSGGDLFKYIDLLKQKLSLETREINAIASFNQTKSKIFKLLGELR